MASMHAASFFLLSIIEFMREKTIQYGSLGFYMNRVAVNTHDALEFLDKVIMPRHQYELTKERFRESSASNVSIYSNLNIFMDVIRGFVIGICAIFVLLYLGLDSMLHSSNPDNFPGTIGISIPQRLQMVIVICTVAVVTYFLTDIFIRSLANAQSDVSGQKDITYDGETFFEPFENLDAIAVYYGLSRTFKDEDNPTSNSQGIWDRYSILTQKGKVAIEIQDVVKAKVMLGMDGKKFKWKDLVVKCTPIYIKEVELYVRSHSKIFVKEYDARTQLELQRLSEVEDKIKCWDTHYLRKELQIRATYMYEIIGKQKDDGPEEVKLSDIVNRYIAPKFKFGELFAIPNMTIKEPEAMPVLSKRGVNSPNECLYDTMTREECIMGCFDVTLRKSTLYAQMPPQGCVFRKERGSYVYIRSFEDRVVFVEGDTKFITDSRAAKTKKPQDECLDQKDCVAVQLMPKPAMLGTTKKPFKFSQVTPCQPGKACLLLKFKISELGDKMDVFSYLDKVLPTMRKWFLDLAESYQNTLYFAPMMDLLNNELALYYNETEVDLVMNRAADIFEELDQNIKRRGTLTNLRYLSKMRFIDKFDAYTIADFNEIQTNVVAKLSTLLGVLRNRFTWEMAKKASFDANSIIEEDRSIQNLKSVFIILTTILAASLIICVIYLTFQSSDTSIGKIGIGCITFTFVCVAMSMLYAIYSRRRVAYDYNLEMLETNSSKLINSVIIIKQMCDTISREIKDNEAPTTRMKSLNIPDAYKLEMYDDIIQTITLMEKCNLLTLDLDQDMPFPMMEIALNVGVIFILLCVLILIVKDIQSTGVAHQISEMNGIIQKINDFPNRFQKSDFPQLFCETQTTSTLILMGASLAVLFGIYISQNLVSYSNTYRNGLYNSKYYEDGQCVKTK
jgi:hypothetical protein